MGTMSLFGNNFNNIERAVSVREQLQSKFASNIANADTPNFKSDNRTFDDMFNKASQIKQTTTNSKHININNNPSTTSLLDDMKIGTTSTKVDVQKEMVSMSENQLMHELALKILKGKINMIKEAIKEGGR